MAALCEPARGLFDLPGRAQLFGEIEPLSEKQSPLERGWKLERLQAQPPCEVYGVIARTWLHPYCVG